MTDMQYDTPPRPAPEGWDTRPLMGFAAQSGPFYFRVDGKKPGVGFYSEPRHCNPAGIVHGGALLTLADMALFNICWCAIGSFRGVTVTMNSEFLGPGPVDEFIEATGEMTRAGRKLLFCRGLITAKEALVMSFSGVLKRLD